MALRSEVAGPWMKGAAGSHQRVWRDESGGRPCAGRPGRRRAECCPGTSVQPHGAGSVGGVRGFRLCPSGGPDRFRPAGAPPEGGRARPERDFLDVRDVCRAYAACLGHELPAGTILNLASGRRRRIGAVLADLLDVAGVTALVETDPGRLRPTDIPVALGDARRARECLGWRPVIPWRQTLSDLLQDWSRRLREEAA